MNNLEIPSFNDLNSIKEFSNTHLFDIALGSFHLMRTNKVRFIDPKGKFGVTSVGRFFFVDECMYIITKNSEYEEFHNSCILEFSEELDILNYTGDYIVRVLFAGIFTGYVDDEGERVWTGDVVKANIIVNPPFPSSGKDERARDINGNHYDNEFGSSVIAGVNVMYDQYSLILDNHSVPLSWATKIKVIGSLFYNLKKGDTELDIQQLCNMWAQSREPIAERLKSARRSPYYPPTTWQESALELLCGTNNNNENE